MGKPVCSRCGQEHWRFVRCADAPEANQQEAARAETREQAKVHPVWRDGGGRLVFDRRTSFATSFAPPRNHDAGKAA